ncbi:MAG: hypothetical protein INH41_19180, partial [Myxococcaceae bacterium]|nr:hypothetical protein [Myxococcaceae bacterium]
SGTLEGGRPAMLLGLLYSLTFLAVALVVPPLLVAGLLDVLVARWRARVPRS